MSKDVINDRYARLYEFPYQLATRGHTLLGICINYHDYLEEGDWRHEAGRGQLTWHSFNLGAVIVPGLIKYLAGTSRLINKFQPDIIIGASDIPNIVLAKELALKLKVPYAIDLYDNFESFGQARIPGAIGLLRRAVQGAEFISCVSDPLRNYVVSNYMPRGKAVTLESTIDKEIFKPRNRAEARSRLNLPINAKLIGTAGGLSIEKGLDTLYEAFKIVGQRDPKVQLVLAGQVDARLPIPSRENIKYLGLLAHSAVADLFSALDVGVICIRNSRFGQYCFPQKAYEMLACKIPVVAADVGAIKNVLSSCPLNLFRAEDPVDLAERLLEQLRNPVAPEVPIKDWSELSVTLEKCLSAAIQYK
jgi:glycosyltransferase involved in cell wall biosynthesis